MKRFTRLLIAAPGLAIIAVIILLAVVQGSGGLAAPADGLNSCVDGVAIKRVFPAIPPSVAFCWYHQFSIPNRADISFWTPVVPGDHSGPNHEWTEFPAERSATWPEFAYDVVDWEVTDLLSALGIVDHVVTSDVLLVVFCALVAALCFARAWLGLLGFLALTAMTSMLVAGRRGMIIIAIVTPFSILVGFTLMLISKVVRFTIKRARIRTRAQAAPPSRSVQP